MKIVCISDTHNQHGRITLPKGDVLVHSGDITGRGEYQQYRSFSNWIVERAEALGYSKVIVVPGNHDCTFETEEMTARAQFSKDITLLINESCYHDGLIFYGSPHTPRFFDWAFNVDRDSDKMRAIWANVPNSTDVLITHGPPFGILDRTDRNEPVGCKPLLKRVMEISPKLHIFGHIHHGAGSTVVNGITFVNASSCNEQYKPVNPPIVIEVEVTS